MYLQGIEAGNGVKTLFVHDPASSNMGILRVGGVLMTESEGARRAEREVEKRACLNEDRRV